MQRFRFAYAALLRVKRRAEQLAAARLASATLHWVACRAVTARLRDALADAGRAMEQSVRQALPGPVWAGAAEQSARLAVALRDAEDQEARAEAAWDEAVIARARANAEVEMLESLEEQARRDHARAGQRADQQALDERGLRAWRDARRDEPTPGGETS